MATTDIVSILPPTGWTFQLGISDEVAGQRGVQVRTKQLGPDLWKAHYESNQLTPALARKLKGMITLLLSQRGTFYVWDPRGQYPAADPLGALILTPADIKINSLNADSQRMSLKGLPVGYTVTAGDYLSFTYGSARALHQIGSPVTTTADGSGITAEFYVAPRIRSGASVNAVVTLQKPTAEMLIIPSSFSVQEFPLGGSISFDAVQVLP